MGAGESWRKKREVLGKSLDDVSADLRVSRRFLAGIEEGNYSGLPVKVFSAGFIRAYAKYLGADPEPVLTEYYQSMSALSPGEQPAAVKPEWLEREKQKGSRRTTYMAAAAVVLVLGIVLAWISMKAVPRPPAAPRPAATIPASPAAPAENAEVAATPGPLPAAGVAAAGTAGPGKGSEAPAARDRKGAAGTTPQAAGGKPQVLLVEAQEQTWLMYARDNAAPVDVILNPGDRIGIRAERKIVLKVGNAGGVTATLNGKPLPPLGPRGKVKEFRVGE